MLIAYECQPENGYNIFHVAPTKQKPHDEQRLKLLEDVVWGRSGEETDFENTAPEISASDDGEKIVDGLNGTAHGDLPAVGDDGSIGLSTDEVVEESQVESIGARKGKRGASRSMKATTKTVMMVGGMALCPKVDDLQDQVRPWEC